MKKNIIIIGAGLHAEVVKNIISYDSNYNFIGYLDDNKKGNKIIGKIEEFNKYVDNHFFICAIGDNDDRGFIFNEIKKKGGNFINAIHPKSYIENSVELGVGIMVGANVYINIESKIGDNTIINNGVIIEHHNIIGNHCHLAPGVITGGTVNILNNTFIGIGSTIINNIFIGSKNIIGAGSLINKNVNKDNIKVYGVPFKYI